MVPNIGPTHISLNVGSNATALGWKQYSQIAYPQAGQNSNNGNPSTMPASQMSRYTSSHNNATSSNFPDINNPQPVTAPGGKRSVRVVAGAPLGQRNEVCGGSNLMVHGPPPMQSYESGPQQIGNNGHIFIPGTNNTLILDQKVHATFYNNSPEILALKAQHNLKLINTDIKRKDRVLLNKSQLRDGRP